MFLYITNLIKYHYKKQINPKSKLNLRLNTSNKIIYKVKIIYNNIIYIKNFKICYLSDFYYLVF